MTLRDGNNPAIARTVTSCDSCLAWGLTYRQGVCAPCYSFASRYKTTAHCTACTRCKLLKAGYCRLCWTQAALDRATGHGRRLAPYLREVRHQQLFLAGLNPSHAIPRALPHDDGAKGDSSKAPPPAAIRPNVIWLQLPLLIVPRYYRYGRVNPNSGAAPENPWLDWALHLAHAMAEARGFHLEVLRSLERTLRMLLAEHRDGELIRSSDFYDMLRERNVSITHTSEVLKRMGVLLDDRPAPFEKWLANSLDRLDPGIRSEAERWARFLHDGGPRSRSRAPGTAKEYLRLARPALLEWSEHYSHLRQVTREDILAHADTLHGNQRRNVLVSLRSLFAWAKKNGVIFRNPTSHIRVGTNLDTVLQPLPLKEIDRTIKAVTTPQGPLFVALAAVHAARSSQIRALRLDDVDLPNRRLTIAEHTRPLDDFTHQILLQWLDHRRQRWPNTANKHLFISAKTANGLGPVSRPWTNNILRGLTATLERLRIDRQLDEALTHRADPLHLTAVFDISDTTAIRYADSARQLLEQPLETHPSSSPQTQTLPPA
jgi:integrase